MQDHPDSNKFASADKPVNRRTIKPASSDLDQAINPLVLARIKAAEARQRLGPRLTTQLELGQGSASHSDRRQTALVLPAIAFTLALVGVLLGAINGQTVVTVVAGVGSAAGFLWGYVTQRRQRARTAGNAAPQIELVSAAELNAIDSVLEQLSESSNETLLERATQLKDTIARCLNALQKGVQATASTEEQLFLREAIRRYIPDSVNAWLKVNDFDRATLRLENGSTATEVLAGQLKTLDEELRTREQRLSSALSEALLQQQRFLEAKTGKAG